MTKSYTKYCRYKIPYGVSDYTFAKEVLLNIISSAAQCAVRQECGAAATVCRAKPSWSRRGLPERQGLSGRCGSMTRMRRKSWHLTVAIEMLAQMRKIVQKTTLKTIGYLRNSPLLH